MIVMVTVWVFFFFENTKMLQVVFLCMFLSFYFYFCFVDELKQLMIDNTIKSKKRAPVTKEDGVFEKKAKRSVFCTKVKYMDVVFVCFF